MDGEPPGRPFDGRGQPFWTVNRSSIGSRDGDRGAKLGGPESVGGGKDKAQRALFLLPLGGDVPGTLLMVLGRRGVVRRWAIRLYHQDIGEQRYKSRQGNVDSRSSQERLSRKEAHRP